MRRRDEFVDPLRREEEHDLRGVELSLGLGLSVGGNSKRKMLNGSYEDPNRKCKARMEIRNPVSTMPTWYARSTIQEEASKSQAMESSESKMPCVMTKGGDGRITSGVLYRYNEMEEVMIVCVCHGSSFSPAEFVRHAGGMESEHPLRQIMVLPS